MLSGILFLSGEFILASTNSNDALDTNKEVKIEVITIDGDNPRPRPRSERPIVTAELSGDQLMFDFDEKVGVVVITVKNSMGEVVGSCDGDTSCMPIIILDVPTDTSDYYSINIQGNNIEAIGEYDTFQ